MGKFIKQIELYILLMVFWFILNGALNIRLLFYGTFFSFVILKLTYDVLFEYDNALLHLPPLWRFMWFGAVVFISIIKSSLIHVIRIIKNESNYITFKVQLQSDNVIIGTLIANAITLTPGTITIDLEGNELEVIGFAKTEADKQALIHEILSYEKPFRR